MTERTLQIVADSAHQAQYWAHASYGVHPTRVTEIKRLRRRSKDGRGQYVVTYTAEGD